MHTSKPSSITVEEAVARMINLDYIPTGFTLLDMTAAFQEEAEVDHDNALIDRLPEKQISILKLRMDACRARHSLAQWTLEALRHEIDNPEASMVVLSNDSSGQARLTLESVSNWAFEKYGIGIAEWSPYEHSGDRKDEPSQNINWEDVTIKIYAEYRIGYFLKDGKGGRSTFNEIGLMGKRKRNDPNRLGGILIGLSVGEKFPKGRYAASNYKTAISKLRRALEKLTGISSDPFYPFNEGDGWKPRFKLIDDRRNAEDRAKEKAVHVGLDETRDYEHEDDKAQKWIDDQE